jgi:predicted nucleic acid-binding protein
MLDNSTHQFVDTNILVYAHDVSAGSKHQQAKAVIHQLWDSKSGCLSVQVLQEFHVTITQKVSKPLDVESSAKIIEDLSFWRVYAPDIKDILSAIDLQHRYTISFWDAMVIWSAIQLDCEILWSEDLSSGQLYEGVQLLNPFDN